MEKMVGLKLGSRPETEVGFPAGHRSTKLLGDRVR